VTVVGTRGSALALAQTEIVRAWLGGDTEIRVVRTAGDDSQRPLRELGDGIFVAAIEDALRTEIVDLAVHSLKDLPTDEPADLVIAAIPEREDPRDVLVTRGRAGLAGLARDAIVGTSSPRRAAFLRVLRPDASPREIRGNVDTRLRKVRDGEYDATIVAAAGLRRLGIEFSDDEVLPVELCPPAPGQGALAVQVRAADRELRARLAEFDHRETRLAVTTERALLRALGGSCTLALGAYGHVANGEIRLEAALVVDGSVARAAARGADPNDVAQRVADALGTPARA
jgi:hydroxymethylbilane synthase